MSTKVNPTDITKAKADDWRLKLFGDQLRLNTNTKSGDVEQGLQEVSYASISDAFDGYEYLALFFGANYCPFCKDFAPTVVAAAPAFEAKKTKVIFVSNDRDAQNYEESCKKVQGIDVMSYDLSKTAQMRDLFGLKTIPALMILQNKDFEKDEPFVVSNARDILELDPDLKRFPWGSIEKRQAAPLTAWDRLFIHGMHGKWWQLGHKNVSPLHPGDMYMDEHAVRIRAGLLNVITWVAIMNVFYMRNLLLVNVIFGIVSWEFVTSMLFGLTPFAPLGIIATLVAVALQPSPLWKPATPKRFAWAVGLLLALTCFILVQKKDEIDESAFRASVAAVALTCNLFTWLESAAGFCVGCFVYNNVFVKYLGKEECKECRPQSGPAAPQTLVGLSLEDCGFHVAKWLEEATGIEGCRLVGIGKYHSRLMKVNPKQGEEFPQITRPYVSLADEAPFLLTTRSSLADLNKRLGKRNQVDMRRFRPNIVIDGFQPWEEDSFKRIRIGAVEFHVWQRCGRCTMTTIDRDSLERCGEPLKTLSTFRERENGQRNFGMHLIPVRPWELKGERIFVGDQVEVLEYDEERRAEWMRLFGKSS